MDITLCYAIIYIVEGLIFWIYCNNFLSCKKKSFTELLMIALGYSVLFIASLFDNFWINTAFFMSVNFLLIFILYDVKWYFSILQGALITALNACTELVILSFITHFSPDFYSNISYFRNLSMLAVLSKLLYFFAMLLISKLIGIYQNKDTKINRGTIILMTIPFLTLFVLVTLFNLCLNSNLTLLQDWMISISSLLVLIINVLVFYFYNYNHKINENNISLCLQLERNKAAEDYYNLIQIQDEQQKILLHDIKNHLTSISLINSAAENNSKISDYINNLINSDALSPKACHYCDNNLVNSLLSHYANKCSNLNITLNLDVRLEQKINFTDYELTSILSNLFDNAIEACLNCDSKNIDFVIKRQVSAPVLVINIENSCIHMPKKRSDGTLLTSKKNKTFHGYGLRSVNNTIKKCNGKMETFYDKEKLLFKTIIAIPIL